MADSLTDQMLDTWANSEEGPVACVLNQRLTPLEGDGGVIFPATYADIGYNIDTLSDGSKVASIDSVGSQANRMEPLFKHPPYSELVPQINILYGNEKTVSILDAGHRLGDALIRCIAKDENSGFDLREAARDSFLALRDRNDASEIARLAPTSLVFGAWDSRDTQVKVPRLVQSVIRAWNVDELRRSAQYSPPIDYSELDVFSEDEKKKQEGDPKSPLAKRGFVHVPAAHSHGGVIANGPIERTVTINLIALRRLDGNDADTFRKYVLGLSLVAATAPLDPFLRQGCFLVPDPEVAPCWKAIDRQGARTSVDLTPEIALSYAQRCAEEFGVQAPRQLLFSKERAREDAKKTDKKKSS